MASVFELTVRGGGHNFAGSAVADDALMIYLSPMSHVIVDPAARRTRCGGGATWADMVQAAGRIVTASPDEHPDLLWAIRGGGGNFGAGSYVNFMTDIEAERVKASYGAAKYERLARIKAEDDPDNVFHRNANIRPAVVPA
jgi:FAD/FMN-containing dehydrogenase